MPQLDDPGEPGALRVADALMCRGRLVLHGGRDDDRDGGLRRMMSQSNASVSIPTAPPTKNSWPSRTNGAIYRSNRTSQRSSAAGGMARGPVMVMFMALHCRAAG